MGHRNINISDEVYEALAKLKFPGESFNALLFRLVSGKRTRGADFNKVYGKLKHIPDEDWNKVDAELKAFWKTWKMA